MKKRMKQIMAVVLGMSMAAGLCACGGGGCGTGAVRAADAAAR